MPKLVTYLGWKVDFLNPPGAPAFVGPDSVSWRVFKNPVALAIGGVAAVLLEFADARIRSGVWEHSIFKTDPIGRSERTGMAAMVGVYGPQSVARRVIAGVTNMHARVEGRTPSGERYTALDAELLDWVSATAGYGFLAAYHNFVAPISPGDKRRYYAEGEPVARLYGVQSILRDDADFLAMMDKRAPRFEPHEIVFEFLDIVETGTSAPAAPRFLRRALARASVSLLPPIVRERLALGEQYNLSGAERLMLKTMGAIADRTHIPNAPPAHACRRLGLPSNFLYLSRAARQRVLDRWTPNAQPAAAA